MMKISIRRTGAVLLAVSLVLALAVPALAKSGPKAKKASVTRTVGNRQTLIIHEGFPIQRTWPTVIVRSSRQDQTYVRPVRYDAPIYFTPVTNAAPLQVSWRNTERILPQDGWVESRLFVDSPGRRLFLLIDGRMQLSFAEIIFNDGTARAIDFRDNGVRSGRYLLADFGSLRPVAQVRLVGRARGGEARASVLLDR